MNLERHAIPAVTAMLKTLANCVNNLADQIQKSPANDTLRSKHFCGLTDVQMLALLGFLLLVGAIICNSNSSDSIEADHTEAAEVTAVQTATQQTPAPSMQNEPTAQPTPTAQQSASAQQDLSVAVEQPAPTTQTSPATQTETPHKEIPSGFLPLDGAELCLRTVYALDKVTVEDMEIATSKPPSKYQAPDGIYVSENRLYTFADTMVYLGAEDRYVPAAETNQDTDSEFVSSFKPCYFSPAAPLPSDKVVVEEK